MATIVEQTAQNAKNRDQRISLSRDKEFIRMGCKMKKLITRFVKENKNGDGSAISLDKWAEAELNEGGIQGWISRALGISGSDDLADLDQSAWDVLITRRDFDNMMRQSSVQSLMDDLELADINRVGLFDVLDADGSGTLSIEELVAGILEVRGEARKSDVIACRLSVRAMQEQLKSSNSMLMHLLIDVNQHVHELAERFRQSKIGTRSEAIASVAKDSTAAVGFAPRPLSL